MKPPRGTETRVWIECLHKSPCVKHAKSLLNSATSGGKPLQRTFNDSCIDRLCMDGMMRILKRPLIPHRTSAFLRCELKIEDITVKSNFCWNALTFFYLSFYWTHIFLISQTNLLTNKQSCLFCFHCSHQSQKTVIFAIKSQASHPLLMLLYY